MSTNKCSNCQIELKPVFDKVPKDKDYTLQYTDAIAIHFIGGYGMFHDMGFAIGADPNEYTAIICHDCMHEMMDAYTWINEMFNGTCHGGCEE